LTCFSAFVIINASYERGNRFSQGVSLERQKMVEWMFRFMHGMIMNWLALLNSKGVLA
jgi:hypothetical protein